MVVMILGFIGCVTTMIWPENSPARAKGQLSGVD